MQAGPVLETVLYAADIAAAQAFYGEVLGLPVHRAVDDRFAFFRCDAQMLLIFNPLFTQQQSSPEGPPPHGATGAGHVCFRATLAEIEQWQAHFSRHGIAIERRMTWTGGGQSLYVRDPAGNSVEFAEAQIWNMT